MELTRITPKNYVGFQKILPMQIEYENSEAWGCLIEKRAVGTAVINITEDVCRILWLWVSPAYRNQGVGSALLEKLCESVRKKERNILTITYPEAADWSIVMGYLLLKFRFTVEISVYPEFCFTRKQLMEASFISSKEGTVDQNVIPLTELSPLQKKELIAEIREKGNYPITALDFTEIEEDRSMAFIQEGDIRGVVLVGTRGAKDRLSLDLFYLKKNAGNAALTLLRQTALRALSHPAGLKEFRFLCTDDVAVKICTRLMGEQEPTEIEYYHGRYWV